MSEDQVQDEARTLEGVNAGENIPTQPLPVDKSGSSGRVIEIVGSIILASITAVLFDSGYHRLGDACMLLAIICGIQLIARFSRGKGLKGVTKWSNIASIAAAVFVICFGHGPDPVGTKPTDMLSRPDAEEIIDKYEQAIPMQQVAVASGFIGLPVIWKLELRKANGDQGIVHLVLIANHNGSASSDIRIDVPEKGNEFLKVANKGDAFVVKSNIVKVGDLGIDLASGGTILPAK